MLSGKIMLSGRSNVVARKKKCCGKIMLSGRNKCCPEEVMLLSGRKNVVEK